MKKEYNDVTCEGCGNVFRVRVSNESYGQIIEVTCKSCGLIFKTIGYDKGRLDPLIEELNNAINKAVVENEGISIAIHNLYEAGFSTELTFSGGIVAIVQKPSLPFQGKVILGKISPGTFVEKDVPWMRELGVDLEKEDERAK